MKKRILALVGTLALVAVLLVPGVAALAATGPDTTTGSTTSTNNTPTITSVTLKDSDGDPTSTLVPLDTFLLEIVAGDSNTIDHIDYIDIEVYYSAPAAVGGAVADDGGSTTVETTEANEATADDMTLLPETPAVEDAYYIGADHKFGYARLNVGTAGAGTWTITWKYWDGSAWTALSNVTDGTDGFTAAAGSHDVTFDTPADWATTTVAAIASLYWVKAEVTAYTSLATQPKGTQAWIPSASPGAWDADACAIYKWDDTDGWSMEVSAGVTTNTWTIDTDNCVTPIVFTNLSDTWTLEFTPGKIAQEVDVSAASWDFYVKVVDLAAASVEDVSKVLNSMGAYCSISTTADIDFGNVALGATAAIQTPGDNILLSETIANDTHTLQVKSATTWSDGVPGHTMALKITAGPGSNEFCLTIDDATSGSGHPSTPQYLTTADYVDIDSVAPARTATIADAPEVATTTNLYMDIILGSTGIYVGTFTGTIYLQVTN